MNAGQAAQGYIVGANTANYLRQQNTTNQLALWQQLTASEQKMVTGAGYKPPHPHQSLLGTITGGIGHGLSDALNLANAGARAFKHGVRTAFAIANQHPNDPQGGSWSDVLSSIAHPSEWAHAWNQTANGEHYILPQVQRQVLDKYGQQTFDTAMKLATGGNAAQMIAAAPAGQQQQLTQYLMSDPKLHAALTELDAGHVSVGRMLAYQVFGEKPQMDVVHGGNPLTAGNLLSAATDATVDWFGDPLVIGLKAAKVAGTARYLVQNGRDVMDIYQRNGAVQAAFQRMADAMKTDDWATTITQQFPKLSPMVDTFRDYNPQTADDVAQMFADQADLRSLVEGRAPMGMQSLDPASLPGGIQGGILPHLSTAGIIRLGAKGELQKVIDWAADRPATIEGLQPGDVIDHPINALGTGAPTRIVTASGQFLRRLLTLTPTGDSFNANDPNWFAKLRDIAMMALPRARANQLLNEYAASATLAGRRNIYAGMLKEIQAAMGIDQIPGVSDWADNVLNPHSIESVFHQAYAPGGIDNVWREGNLTRDGILRSDMTDIWQMPNFRELYAQSKKLGVMRAVNGSLNNQMVDKFMNQAWKPLALARFGFAVRVAGEEAFGMLLRANPTAYLQARAAGSMLHQQMLADDPDLHGRLASTWGWLTAHLPQAAQDRIKTPTDLVVEHLGDATSRAMARVAGAFAGDRYRQAVRLMADNGILDPDGAFGRYASASESHGGAFYDQAMSELRTQKVWAHGRWAAARMTPTGAYTEYEPTAQLFTNFWYKRLHSAANDPWARTALEQRAAAPADRLQAVADALKADPAWTRARRSLVTTDGRYVGQDATLDEAANDHAKAIIDLVDSLTRHENGEVPGLVDHLLDNRKPPTVAALDMIPEDERPAAVTGPEMVPMLDGWTGAYTRGVNRMFTVLGKQIDWISRQPMFIHNFTASLDAYQPLTDTWRAMGLGDKDVEANLVHAATDRALKLTLPYIHSPELRSQFEVITRNVMPFMFAQEQFYKRWARTAAFSPWAFRQAQLISQGVAHSGFTHTDPATGQQYFVYPGAGAVQDVLTRALGAFGYQAFLPIEANLRGQVNQASPGLERLGLPNLGPVVVVPLKVVSSIFPEVRGPAQAIEGQQAASTGYISSLVPTTIARVWQDFTSTPNNSPQFASAMMQAIQYLEASGHGIGTVAQNNIGVFNGIGKPPERPDLKPGDYVTDQAGKTWVVQADGQWRQNDPAALTAYMQRVKNWTRVFLITRTLFGFNAPASPEALFDPSHVNEDFQALLKEFANKPDGYQQAVAAFMKLHPDASAYTVFQSKNQAGAPLPATAAAMQFMDANAGFFNDHKLAGAFFIPTQDSSGKFDQKAYQNQLQEQLRVKRTPTEFWQEIAYGPAANIYFAAENLKNQMLQTGTTNRRAVDEAWTSESQQFLKANPLFAQQLADAGGAYSRADIEQDLAAALNDPRLPENPQTEDIRQLFNAWTMYQTMTAPYAAPGGNTLGSQQRYQLELQFARRHRGFWLTTRTRSRCSTG